VYETPVVPRTLDRLLGMIDDGDAARFKTALARVADRLGGQTLWHINSTPEGGGVAELLRSNLGYLADGGLGVRWLVLEGDPGFFQITKRIHNRLHGDMGDLGPLGPEELAHYEAIIGANWDAARALVRPGDVAVVHDPQPAGLVPRLAAAGVHVIWTCHVGVDVTNDVMRSAWDLLRPFVADASGYVFTREAYVWEGLDRDRVRLIPPCIDPLSSKNRPIEPERREAIMGATGLAQPSLDGDPDFERHDGSIDRVVRPADVLEMMPVPPGAPLVAQVSRWDRLKDPVGVLTGFADAELGDAHLILAGPSPASVADDPEAGAVLTELRDAWLGQHVVRRERIHIANLPTADVDENAIIVNALQRRADVVVQKSLAEGFGLTVTEAMWKERPVVAGRVGGIVEQIEDGVQGELIDPRDLLAFGQALTRLFAEPDRAARLGVAARERVRERFLPPHYLAANLELIDAVAG
jgi:trehalose synthase